MNFTATTHRSVTHTITIDDEEIVVEFPPDGLIDGFRSEDGNLIRFAVRDEAPHDYEWPEGVEFAHSDRHAIGEVSDIDGWVESRLDDPGVTIVPMYVDGYNSSYSVDGPIVTSMEEWEEGRWKAAIAIDSDPTTGFTNPPEAAVAILSEYSSWAEGDVFGIVEMARKADGTWEETDMTCWGFIGSEYVQKAVTEGVY